MIHTNIFKVKMCIHKNRKKRLINCTVFETTVYRKSDVYIIYEIKFIEYFVRKVIQMAYKRMFIFICFKLNVPISTKKKNQYFEEKSFTNFHRYFTYSTIQFLLSIVQKLFQIVHSFSIWFLRSSFFDDQLSMLNTITM